MTPFLAVVLALGVLELRPAAAGADSGFEHIPPNEAEQIRETVELLETFVQRESEDGSRPALRAAHAKGHGCVEAEFRVPELDPSLRVGVFREPNRYPALIRFSNASNRPSADARSDSRGMAIKLFGVPGEKLLATESEADTQDFVMINFPVFFVDSVANYLAFTRQQVNGNLFSYFILHLRQLFLVLSAQRAEATSPLAIRYWSMSPYLFGDRAMKYSATPCRSSDPPSTPVESPDFLADRMADQLATGGACFDFSIQLRVDSARMPIEDPTVEWSEEAAPFVKVAEIQIPQQEFRSEAQIRACENVSMNPWHSIPEHRPLGGINRLRRSVYEATSRLRRELNEVRTQPRPASRSSPTEHLHRREENP